MASSFSFYCTHLEPLTKGKQHFVLPAAMLCKLEEISLPRTSPPGHSLQVTCLFAYSKVDFTESRMLYYPQHKKEAGQTATHPH
jgi:hypothetical protein